MRTFVEKILNAPAGSIVIRRPDIVMSHDNSARIRKIFEEMGQLKAPAVQVWLSFPTINPPGFSCPANIS